MSDQHLFIRSGDELPLGGIHIKPKLRKIKPKSGLENSAFKGWHFWLLVLLGIVILSVLAFVLVYFIALPKGRKLGDSCFDENQCDAKLFCSADNTCQEGTGLIKGDKCESSSQCLLGQICSGGFCGG